MIDAQRAIAKRNTGDIASRFSFEKQTKQNFSVEDEEVRWKGVVLSNSSRWFKTRLRITIDPGMEDRIDAQHN